MSNYEIRQCSDKNCALRFPIGKNHPQGQTCPGCGAPTYHRVDIETAGTEQMPPDLPATSEQPLILEVLLDNIRSLLNVGVIFRSADGVGVRHLHLCGITPTPENPKLKKTALGAEKVVPWTQNLDGLETAQRLQKQGYHIWALESPSSLSLNDPSDKLSENTTQPDLFSIYDIPLINENHPIVLVVGNEVTGIDPHILALCDAVLYIPMQGLKQSLNVATATGIALYMLAAAIS